MYESLRAKIQLTSLQFESSGKFAANYDIVLSAPLLFGILGYEKWPLDMVQLCTCEGPNSKIPPCISHLQLGERLH